jgi:hypothetical protein
MITFQEAVNVALLSANDGIVHHSSHPRGFTAGRQFWIWRRSGVADAVKVDEIAARLRENVGEVEGVDWMIVEARSSIKARRCASAWGYLRSVERDTRTTYYVVVNIAAHEGQIVEVADRDLWSNENPNGVTHQGICGSHGTIMLETNSRSVAESALEAELRCDAAERGTYCYAHNAVQS